MDGEMHIIRQCKTGAPAASIPQIAADPERVNLGVHRRLQKVQ
jgi:hypothetical protein